MTIILNIRTLFHIVLCAVVLTALAMLGMQEKTGTSTGEEPPARQSESVFVKAGH